MTVGIRYDPDAPCTIPANSNVRFPPIPAIKVARIRTRKIGMHLLGLGHGNPYPVNMLAFAFKDASGSASRVEE